MQKFLEIVWVAYLLCCRDMHSNQCSTTCRHVNLQIFLANHLVTGTASFDLIK